MLGLFSTRYILDALGAQDFGIYSLVASVVAFLAFLNNSMAIATSRFLSFHQNPEGGNLLSKVFSSSLFLHFGIGMIVVVVLEAIRIYLFDGVLIIDASRIDGAIFVFHSMVVSFFFVVMSAPYDGCIISHERFVFYTIFGLTESIAKFAISLLLYVTPFGRLESFGALIACISFVGLLSRWIYCRVKFDEAKLVIANINKATLIEITSFSIWNLFDLLSSVFKYSAMDLLINTFHGTLANAANAVSKQVSGSLLSFSSSIYSASRPQIVQAISRNNTEEAISKTVTISRLGFVFMALFSIPLFVEMPIVLGMWLKKVPENAIPFCRLGLISNLVALMTVRGFSALLDGIGRIKAYRLTMSLCNLFAFPAAYVLLRQGFPPYAIFFGILLSDVFQVLVTVHFTVRYTDLTWSRYLSEIPLRLVPIVAGVASFLFFIPWPEGMTSLLRLVCTTATSSFLLLGLFWFALSQDEKNFAKNLWAKLLARIQNLTN